MALFWSTGIVRWSNDALHRLAMIGTNSLESFLRSQVGTGSNVHCFAGAVLSTFAISSDVTGLKCDSGSDTERLVMRGAGASAVEARIRSNLFVIR